MDNKYSFIDHNFYNKEDSDKSLYHKTIDLDLYKLADRGYPDSKLDYYDPTKFIVPIKDVQKGS